MKRKIELAPRVCLLGTEGEECLEASFATALRAEGATVTRFSVPAFINRAVRLGGVGRKLQNFLPVERWTWRGNRQLLQEVRASAPDLVLVFCTFEVTPGFLAHLKAEASAKIGLVWPDPIINLTQNTVQCLPLYDQVYSFSRQAVDSFKALRAPSVTWLPLAADPNLHSPPTLTESERMEFGADVTFVGGWRPEREKLLSGLTQFRLKVWGPNWDRQCRGNRELLKRWQGRALNSHEFSKTVAASRINLNLIDELSHGAANMRFFEIFAAGGFQLCNPCPDFEKTFQNERELAYADSNAEAFTQRLKELLGRDEPLKEMAQRGYRKVLADHTYRHRARIILKDLSVRRARVA